MIDLTSGYPVYFLYFLKEDFLAERNTIQNVIGFLEGLNYFCKIFNKFNRSFTYLRSLRL